MGLLDGLMNRDMIFALGLMHAGSPKVERTSIGEGLLNSMKLADSFTQAQEDRRAAAEDRKQRGLMQSMQMDQLRAAMEAQQQARLEARQAAEARNRYLGSVDPSQGPAMPVSPAAALSAGLSPQELSLIAPAAKDKKPHVLSQGQVAFDDAGNRLFGVPAEPKTPEGSPLAKLISEMGALPPGDPMRKVYEQAIAKTATHQPGVSVSYGAPMAGVDSDGNSVFFQPNKTGGTPAIVPGVKPAPQNRDTKLPAELQRMQIAGESMVKLMDDYETMLKKHNPRDPLTQINPAIRADMQSLKRNIELQFKELQALGALAGPDIDIMRQSLADPFSMSGAYYGRDGLLAQIKRARDLVRIRAQAVQASQGKPQDATPATTNDDPLGLR